MMKWLIAFVFGVACLATGAAEEVLERKAEELARFEADEAHQGVAVDGQHLYALTNAAIGKYDKETGARLARWAGPEDGPWIHINSCKVTSKHLRCAHSNSPALPTASSVEFFDLDSLEPKRSRSLGVLAGSLTWIDAREGARWLLLARYNTRTPKRGTAVSQLVRFDRRWRRTNAWVFPEAIVERLAPHSVSGGAWGDDGLLYVTGHHRKEMYVLRLPDAGVTLKHVATIAVPIEGQAFAFDRTVDDRIAYGIVRRSNEVVKFRLPKISENKEEP